MITKSFRIADCRFALCSETPIADSPFFSLFRSEDIPETKIDVRCGTLPDRAGELLFASDTVRVYRNGAKLLRFSAYFDSRTGAFRDYACFVTDKAERTLFVRYAAGLWDSMIADALDLPTLLLQNHRILLHSAFIRTERGAILFAADRQVGKSTQAALWQSTVGAEIVNGDRAVLGKRNGQWTAFGTPFCGSSKICKNISAPIHAVVFPEQAEFNEVHILSPAEGFRRLLGKLTYNAWDTPSALSAQTLALSVVQDVPCCALSCTPDAEAVRTLREALWKN